MYSRDIPKLPNAIPREQFVQLVFELGFNYRHGYDSIIAAVQLGDYFVSFTGPRLPYLKLTGDEENQRFNQDYRRVKREFSVMGYGSKPNFGTKALLINQICAERKIKTFMDEPIPQVYSIELAHVVTVIMGKGNEDHNQGYNSTKQAIINTDNCYVDKMEWELLTLLGFTVKVHNFITIIGALISDEPNTQQLRSLPGVFWDISKEICLNQNLLAQDPRTIIMSIILLARVGKLRALQIYRERKFTEHMQVIARYCDIKFDDLIRTYIRIHS